MGKWKQYDRATTNSNDSTVVGIDTYMYFQLKD